MKKVLPILVLGTLFATLLVPTTASVVLAAACPSNCEIITTVCECTVSGVTSTLNPTVTSGLVCDRGTPRQVGTCSAAVGGISGTAPNAFPRGVSDLMAKINTIGDYVFVALMAVAGMFLIIAGFMYVTAGGSPEKAGKGRQMLINALIGVVIGLLARGIVQVIDSILR